jgi:TPR repeat protein
MDKPRGLNAWSMALAAALALTVATPLLAQSATAGAAQVQAGDEVPTDAELADTHCAIGEERFLPADYYYCLAKQNYGNHHYAYSQKFFTTAAGWASKPAQYVLGIMALNGDHQPVNRPLALAWLALASERPNSDYRLAYESLYKVASADERKASEQLLVTMRQTYADSTAAVRAEQRYSAGMAELTRLSNSGGKYCMAGVDTMAQPNTDPGDCPPAQTVVKVVDTAAAGVFEGWVGHVQVGPLQQVGASADKRATN